MPLDTGSHAKAVRKYRQQGYQDGYAGREPRAVPTWELRPVYERAYREGVRAWTRDQRAELAEWEKTHRG